MKKLFTGAGIFYAFLFLSCSSGGGGESDGRDSVHARISISGAFALYPLAVRWAEEYRKIYPHVHFDVQAGGAGKGLADVLSGMVDAGMVSRGLSPEETGRGAWPVTVARDAVVATCNSSNPFIALLNSRGITRSQFRRIWIDGSVHTWGELLGNSSADKIQVFTRSDAAGAPETWARYLGSTQENLKGIGVFGDPGVAESVAKDKLALGFNNVNYVYDITKKTPFAGLAAVPIDLDSNGVLDASENFYGSIDSLNAAIREGRYPSPPARELYFVFKGKSLNPALRKFLLWALTDGQKYVAPNGYVALDANRLEAERKRLE